MSTLFEAECAWLRQLATSKLIGVCIVDAEGRPVQQYVDDPELRQLIVDYQAHKTRQLLRQETLAATSELAAGDLILPTDVTELIDFVGLLEWAKTRQSA